MVNLTASMGTSHEELKTWLASEDSVQLSDDGRIYLITVANGEPTTLYDGDVLSDVDWCLLTGNFVKLYVGWSPR
jgi:hypothetical protein